MNGVDLKAFACFGDLSEEEREVFGEAMQRITLDAGEEVFREGEDADGLILLVRGRLRLSRATPGLVGSLGPGETLGALSLVAAGPREASVVAETVSEILWLPRTAYRRVADEAPHAACRFVERVLADLTAMMRPGLTRFLRDAVDPARRAQ